jgi:CheY-like chemotaxis protein
MKELILVVDNEPPILHLLSRILIDHKYTVRCADSGTMALQFLEHQLPDLVILDVKMPDINGFEVCKQLKRNPKFSDIPVLFLSGIADAENKVKAFSCGAVDYITKPIEPDELLARVRTHLKIHHLQNESQILNTALEQKVSLRTQELSLINDELKKEINERCKTEKELRNSQELLKEAQQLGQIGHWERDVHTQEMTFSDEMFRIFELEPLNFKTSRETFLKLIHTDDRKRVIDAYRKSIKSKLKYDIEYRINTNKNKIKFVNERGTTEYDDSNIPVRSIGTVQDITRIREAELKKEKTEKLMRQMQKTEALGTLSSGITHDFNNILTGILGYSDLNSKLLEPDSKVFKYNKEILEAGKRAKKLVSQILTFSRQTEQDKLPIEIAPIIDEALALLQASIPSTIMIRRELKKNIGLILGDPTQLHQVIMNLCTNAYQSMLEHGGELTVVLDVKELPEELHMINPQCSKGPYVLLEVSDTGEGMNANTLDRIFDPYFTTKSKDKGTGLGLSVVQGIIKSHHGHISVYSEIGMGTSFKVYLPLLSPVEVKQSEILKNEVKRGFERILLVDDEEVNVVMMTRMLSLLGYQVTETHAPLETLRKFQEHPNAFDCVITDMTMPGLTGTELAREILSIRPDLPIILTTGFSHLINKEKAKETGIKAFIMKPFVLNEIADAIRFALDN